MKAFGIVERVDVPQDALDRQTGKEVWKAEWKGAMTVAGLGTGVLLLGYGSSGWKMKYGGKAERNRSLILPERLDFGPGEDTSSPRGVTFGQVVIDRDGVIHARDFRKLPD